VARGNAHNDAHNDDWVVLRRFDDAMEAEVIVNFLRDHGVSVGLRGNSGATSVLNRFATVLDIRVVVPEAELAHAREVLTAMTAEDATVEPAPELEEEVPSGSPYRGGAARPRSVETRPRSRMAAVVLAFVVPIAGGHFYARHNAAGIILAAGIGGCVLGAMVGKMPPLLVSAALIVLIDAVFASRAARRCNEGRVPPDSTQRAWAVVAVIVAVVTGLAVVR
jgi:hypothetical protein